MAEDILIEFKLLRRWHLVLANWVVVCKVCGNATKKRPTNMNLLCCAGKGSIYSYFYSCYVSICKCYSQEIWTQTANFLHCLKNDFLMKYSKVVFCISWQNFSYRKHETINAPLSNQIIVADLVGWTIGNDRFTCVFSPWARTEWGWSSSSWSSTFPLACRSCALIASIVGSFPIWMPITA